MNELKESIAGEIARLHELAETKATDAKSTMADALQAAVQCGNMLEQAKGITKGQLLGWLRDNVPTLDHHRAKAYMSLFHVAQERGIETIDHRQLMLLGVIDPKESNPSQHPQPDLGAGKWIKWAGNIRGWFSKETVDRPLRQWTNEEKEIVRNQLLPIIEIYKSLE